MDRDTVIALAREARLWDVLEVQALLPELERFANLIEDHLTWSDIHTCNPGCTKPACVSLRRAEAHAAAVEREACAQVCEELELKSADGQLGTYVAGWSDGTDDCAAAIRNRSTHDQNDHS